MTRHSLGLEAASAAAVDAMTWPSEPSTSGTGTCHQKKMPAALTVSTRFAGSPCCHHKDCQPPAVSQVIARIAGWQTGACQRSRQLPLPFWSCGYSMAGRAYRLADLLEISWRDLQWVEIQRRASPSQHKELPV